MGIAAGWITVLLFVGGFGLDRTLNTLITRQFDDQLGYMLTGMVGSAEIGPDGEVFFNRPLGDQRFLEPNSGLYWLIRAKGHEDFASRSLWDGNLEIRGGHFDSQPHVYDSDQRAKEPLRIMERSIILPGSETQWQFAVAESRQTLDTQISQTRSILAYSFIILGLGLFLMAGLQTWYGLGPLRRVRRAIKDMRTTGTNRVTEPLAARSPAAGRGTQCPARAYRAPGRRSTHPRGQSRPCAEDPADRGDERRHRACT